MRNLKGLQVKFTWLGQKYEGTCHDLIVLYDGREVYMCSIKGSRIKYPIQLKDVELQNSN